MDVDAAMLLKRVIDLGLEFKGRPEIFGQRVHPHALRDRLLDDLPEASRSIDDVLDEFRTAVLPSCKNESSPHFLGFGDTGDDVAALAGNLLATFTQQNLINQSFDAPSATFVEIAVLRWLRALIGYVNPAPCDVSSVWDVGGLMTHGGTMSNTVAMMLAREQHAPGTMERGIDDPSRLSILVPRGIGHYSVKSALTWIGIGRRIIEVDTIDYRYDLAALERALREHHGRIMAVVAYAGDSRTHTIEHLRRVHDVVRAVDERVWLHADACWGFLCAFSDQLVHKLDGIACFDSVTMDPHKVMAVPYASSALLVKSPGVLRSIASYSSLIMQEDFAFGQATPFIGTKAWMSLKLWMSMRTHGRRGLAELAERRVHAARAFAARVDAQPRLVRLHDPDLLAVAFLYIPGDVDMADPDVARINEVNLRIHGRMLDEGRWHLHQFALPDDTGRVRRGAIVHPLRFMAANLRIDAAHMDGVLDYVVSLGRELERR